MNGQVIESVELQRHAKKKRPGELGGKAYEAWLGEWARRKAAGERIAVLVDRGSTHCVVVSTEGRLSPDPANEEGPMCSATTSSATPSTRSRS